MNVKLIFSTETKDTEQWTDLPFIPHTGEWVNIREILNTEKIEEIKQSAQCWSGIRGAVQSVEYRHDANDFYAEIYVWCED